MAFPIADYSLDELIEFKNTIDQEIQWRADAELNAMNMRRAELLALLGSAALGTEPPDELAESKPSRSAVVSIAKYRDPASGKTWSGKGKRPRWFDAERADDFLIAA